MLNVLTNSLERDGFSPQVTSINGRWFVDEINSEMLEILMSNDDVLSITLPRSGKLNLEDSVGLINADAVQQLSDGTNNLNGTGVDVCVIDSGVNSSREGLIGKVSTEQCYCSAGGPVQTFPYVRGPCCPNGASTDTNAEDYNGHGTHIAGIVASNDPNKLGVAPGANIIAVKVGDENGDWLSYDLDNAIDFCVNEGADVISISLSYTSLHFQKESTCSNFTNDFAVNLRRSVDDAIDMGSYIVASTGNEYNEYGVSSPACLSDVIGVGATDKYGSFAAYSNGNGGTLVDILAPGTGINSLKSGSGEGCYDADPYLTCTGTSMAAPHVSGAIAILKQIDLSLDPDQIVRLFDQTGTDITDTDDHMLDLQEAVMTYYPELDEEIHRDVYEGQTLTFELDVEDLEGAILDVDLSWPIYSYDLGLTLQAPDGYVYQSSSLGISRNVSSLPMTSGQMGTWQINVTGDSVSGDYADFYFTASANYPPEIEDVTLDRFGGINFTSLNLDYVSTCGAEDIQFVMQGQEANESLGDTIINATNATSNAIDYFMAALVIPDDELWITMDITTNSTGDYVGDVSRVNNELARTKLGQTLLAADVQLKVDQFGEDSEDFELNMMNDWVSDVQASSYWSEYQAQGFNEFPQGLRRTWITPSNLDAYGDECTVTIENVTLNVSYTWDSFYLDTSSYSFSSAAEDELESLLDVWVDDHTSGHYSEVSNTTIERINSADEYAELRRAATSIALAQWYKDQDRSTVPFGDIIDSENVSAAGIEISFDEEYWNDQAYQFLYTTDPITNFLGGTTYWDYYGGIEMANMDPDILSEISNDTQLAIDNTTSKAYVEFNDSIYFETTVEQDGFDLAPIAIGFSELTPDSNQTVNITAAIENIGNSDITDNFFVKFSYTYVYPSGYELTNLIGYEEVTGLNAESSTSVTHQTSFEELGDYNITIEIDYNDSISETNELNNGLISSIEVVDPNPTAIIELPENGDQQQLGEQILFAGSGSDYKDGDLDEDLYNWTSSIDGYLSNGSVFYQNLSYGNHVIYFTVEDSDGNVDIDQVLISVVQSSPEATVISPIAGSSYQEGETVYFSGEGYDDEDGDLSGSSLVWNSSLDGGLGYGAEIDTNSLSVGVHYINFTVTDSNSATDVEEFNITIEESTPSVNIDVPTNLTEYLYNEEVNLVGEATDPHDGDISSQIAWVSSLDGYLGTGYNITVNLSEGEHAIIASITDSFGLSDSGSIFVTVLEPQEPIVSILYPTNLLEIVNGEEYTFRASAEDPETGIVDGGTLEWQSSEDGILGNGSELNISDFTIGNHQITVSTIDEDGLVGQTSVNITVESANPELTIDSPLAETVVADGENIDFSATATDYEDGALTGSSIQWESDLDGSIGSGTSFSLSSLSTGIHTITVTATDSHGEEDVEQIQIAVASIHNATISSLSGESSTIINFDTETQDKKLCM